MTIEIDTSRCISNTKWNAQASGQTGGRRARLALLSKIQGAKAEAYNMLASDNLGVREAGEYWLSFYAELERYIAQASQ